MASTKEIIANAQTTANANGYDYIVYRTENGIAFTRKAEYERDGQKKRKIKTIKPEQ